MPNGKLRISAFSTVLVMLVLMTIGAGVVPLLSLQFTPAERTQYITVSFGWANASAKVIEQEATSKIEGVLAGVRGVQKISSTSYKGRGTVTLTLKKGTDMGSVRFEISSLIRQIYSKLPDGVSYPSLSLSAAGYRPQAILVYTFNAGMAPIEIQRWVERHIVTKLSRIEGINNANLSGANPFYYEVAYNSDKMRAFGIGANEIQQAIRQRFGSELVVGSISTEHKALEEKGTQMVVKMENGGRMTDFENLFIKTVNGKQVFLGQIAQISLKEQLP
ncbi:MAG: efflux RND transporter permease subunit, partial [Prevotellaceae bacterium]|nr:efflux RND transporter permease subunit [Prevotellaceae bacterium]